MSKLNAESVLKNALAEVKPSESFMVGDKEIKDKALVLMHDKASLLLAVRKVSDKAMCVEVARLTTDEVKRVGFKSLADYLRKVFESDLTSGQIQDYIRVGKIFADTTAKGYKWKSAIPQDVTLTNLRDVMSLVFEECNGKDEKDVTKLSDTELNKLYDRFVSVYLEGDNPCPLQASNSYLREWKRELKEDKDAIPTTAQEVDGQAEDGQTADVDGQTEDVTEDVIRENAKVALADLMALYRDNEEIEKAVCAVLTLIG